MIHTFFIVSKSGETIIEKHCTTNASGVTRLILEALWTKASKCSDNQHVPPVITSSGNYLINLQRDGLIFVAVLQDEYPPIVVLEFLNRFYSIIRHYLGNVSEFTVKENFSLIYQLLEESLVNGFPVNTDIVKLPSFVGRFAYTATRWPSISDQLPASTCTNIPWRKRGLEYRQNEILFDITEIFNATVNSNGTTIRSSVEGVVECTSHLSGMPEVSISVGSTYMADQHRGYSSHASDVLLKNVKFHPCVRLQQWEKGRTIAFIPPDGSFTLMKYYLPATGARTSSVHGGPATSVGRDASGSTTSNNNVSKRLVSPIYCNPQVTYKERSGRIDIMLGSRISKAQRSSKSMFNYVCVKFKLPHQVLSTNLTAETGKVVYDSTSKECSWEISNFLFESTTRLEGSIKLKDGSIPDSNLSVQLYFESQMKPLSGMKLHNLVLSRESYIPFKGTRALVKSGKYFIRVET